MRPWIAVAYSAPVAAATAVFIIYPIGQGSFSDGMPLGKLIAPLFYSFVKHYANNQVFRKGNEETRLNGESPTDFKMKEPLLVRLGFGLVWVRYGALFKIAPNQPLPYPAPYPSGRRSQNPQGRAVNQTLPSVPECASPPGAESQLEGQGPIKTSGAFEAALSKDNSPAPPPAPPRGGEKGRIDATEDQRIPAFEKSEDNPVPNRITELKKIRARKQAGIYMIRCTFNDWRYYGESTNVAGRLASHKSTLNSKIHPNKALQLDWNTYGADSFEFLVLFLGPDWDNDIKRRGKELELVVADRDRAYNVLAENPRSKETNSFWDRTHTPEAKQKIREALTGQPNDLLGKAVSIDGVVYPSLAEASRVTGIARKTIRLKANTPSQTNYFFLTDS
jgi:hypothetical protein